MLQKPVADTIRCHVCERRCVIPPGQAGWCQTRTNRGGKLLTLVYGAVSTMTANAIEKKPFYHFIPGSKTMTAGSWGCNFPCQWCRNWDISHAPPPLSGEFISPKQFVDIAEESGCQGTAMAFNEPTLALEWILNAFKIASQRGLYNTMKSNGYMTPEALTYLIDSGLDAINIDINLDSFLARQYFEDIDMDRVWINCKIALNYGIHLEITTLVIPTFNDEGGVLEQIAKRIYTEFGPGIPWHIIAYTPAYKFAAPATPIQELEAAVQIGKSAGLDFVYLSNVQGHRNENTECPSCGTLLIRRLGSLVLGMGLKDGHCPKCGQMIPGVWGVSAPAKK